MIDLVEWILMGLECKARQAITPPQNSPFPSWSLEKAHTKTGSFETVLGCPAGSDRFTIVIVSWVITNLPIRDVSFTYLYRGEIIH